MNAEAAHAVFSPSSAHRWTVCTASATAIAAMERVVPQEEGEAAAEGTRAHLELERVLSAEDWNGTKCYACNGTGESDNQDEGRLACSACGGTGDGYGVVPALALEPDPDHPAAYAVALAIAYAKGLPPGQMWIEQRVVLTEHIWGRCDIGHWHAESATLTIVDLKNGFVGVDAEENEQLRIYAAALIRTFQLPVRWIRYVICQPNDFRPGVPRVKQAVESVDVLQVWATQVSAIPNGPLTFRFGAHCRDCPLLGICEPTRDLLPHLGAAMARGPAGDVPPHLIPVFLALKKPIDHFFDSMLRNGAKRVLGGGTVPGMKMVTQFPNRSWRDEAEARAAVFAAKGLDALKPPTPAQAEEMGVEVGALATRGKGYPVLALEADTRPAWAPPSASEMFAAARREES